MHLPGSLAITGDFGDDRTNLLIACRHQESGRAPVGFRTDDRETRFGVRQFIYSVRRNRAAIVEVRINQWREGWRSLDGRVQPEAKLAKKGEVGTEPRCDDDAIDNFVDGLPTQQRFNIQFSACPFHSVHDKGSKHPEATRVHCPLCGKAERSATGKLVVQSASQEPGNSVASQRPDYLRIGGLFLQFKKRKSDVYRRMAASHHQCALPGIDGSIGTEDVWYPVRNDVLGFTLSGHWKAVATHRIRTRPRTGSVNDRPRKLAMLS
jgi:hypothetical protein